MNSGTRLFKLGSFLLLLYNPPEMQKGEMLSEEALEIAEKRKEAKGKGEKERYAEFQRIARRDKKAFLIHQCKEIDWERLETSSRKLEIPREYFMQRWAQ